MGLVRRAAEADPSPIRTVTVGPGFAPASCPLGPLPHAGSRRSSTGVCAPAASPPVGNTVAAVAAPSPCPEGFVGAESTTGSGARQWVAGRRLLTAEVHRADTWAVRTPRLKPGACGYGIAPRAAEVKAALTRHNPRL